MILLRVHVCTADSDILRLVLCKDKVEMVQSSIDQTPERENNKPYKYSNIHLTIEKQRN